MAAVAIFGSLVANSQAVLRIPLRHAQLGRLQVRNLNRYARERQQGNDAAGTAVGAVFRIDQPDPGRSDISVLGHSLATLANGDVVATFGNSDQIFARILPTGFITAVTQKMLRVCRDPDIGQ